MNNEFSNEFHLPTIYCHHNSHQLFPIQTYSMACCICHGRCVVVCAWVLMPSTKIGYYARNGLLAIPMAVDYGRCAIANIWHSPKCRRAQKAASQTRRIIVQRHLVVHTLRTRSNNLHRIILAHQWMAHTKFEWTQPTRLHFAGKPSTRTPKVKR